MSSFRALAQPFLDAGVLSPADYHTVALTAPRYGEADPERLLGLAFAVRAPRRGHAGVDLRRIREDVEAELALRHQTPGAAASDPAPDDDEEPPAPLPWPSDADWPERVRGSPMVREPPRELGAELPPDARCPFVRQRIGDGELFLTLRMYREQERIARVIRARASQPVPEAARIAELDRWLAALFPTSDGQENAAAVRLAAERCLALVVGGPGTGKTFSLARLLAVLVAAEDPARPLGIALAAPTGKAAVRMVEAIAEAIAPDAPGAGALAAVLDARVRERLQRLEASTLHRLLGVRPDGTVRHHAGSPLAAEVVVVDEVSMVDLVLMRQLVEALLPDARLVLLGDRDQLASVEAGCVLADLVGSGHDSPLSASTVRFTHSHRFGSAPDIALVAACLQSHASSHDELPQGDSAAAEQERLALAVEVLTGARHAKQEAHPARRITWLQGPVRRPGQRARPSAEQLRALVAGYLEGFERLRPEGTSEAVPGYVAELLAEARRDALEQPAKQRVVLEAFARYRVLTAHRRGPLGVAGLNRALTGLLRERLAEAGHWRREGGHWLGQPLLVTVNSYDVGLLNGDTGLVLPLPGGALGAVFPGDGPREIRQFPLSRLPDHDDALAMTVHKAQGSQFERVAFVLAGTPSSIQTRELAYTAVTRAQNQLVWLGDEAELRDALGRRLQRASGLEELLG
ncbi:MAG TPA: exodeoxyribonuclease V subunit alpha [Polyangiaceae bacterium]|nr:exodeoxyribonuclease V subunit alpha [Polyangiaceae bacterium]